MPSNTVTVTFTHEQAILVRGIVDDAVATSKNHLVSATLSDNQEYRDSAVSIARDIERKIAIRAKIAHHLS